MSTVSVSSDGSVGRMPRGIETDWRDACLEKGFDHQPGYLTVLPAVGGAPDIAGPWAVQSGDRM